MDIEDVSVMEFFREHVDSALCHQKVRSAEITVFYLVSLLTRFSEITVPAEDSWPKNEALALVFHRALRDARIGNNQQRRILKDLGDKILFVSGFFSESIRKSGADIDYYVAFGTHAFRCLSLRENDALAIVFTDLAERFVVYTDVLNEVSEQTRCATSSDLLRLYEKWLKTGSSRTGQLLVERGVVPNISFAKMRIQ